MTQLTINIEDKSMLPILKKLFKSMNGVSIAPSPRKCRKGVDEALDDIKNGRVYTASSVDEMFKQILD